MMRSAAFVICGLRLLTVLHGESADPLTPPNFSLPQFQPAIFNVRDFGAAGDGRSNDTQAINKAIEKCNASGGGNVIFPAGTYVAASIHVKSNVRFVLDKGALITGAKNGYDAPEPNEFEQYQDFGHSHFHNALMWGEKIDNFAIVGGRINGSYLVERDPNDQDIGDKVIAIKSGRNLLFENVTHETGGHFVYLLNDCENVTITNVTIRKSRDGVNLVGCRNVQLHNCAFTGCGDDTIALKSDWALGRKIASENIYVWDAYLESGGNALQFGSETTGDFHNANFWNIRIGKADKAAISMTCADGGTIDGVAYDKIDIKGAICPISFSVFAQLRSGDPAKKIGHIKNVMISNLTVTDCARGRDGQVWTANISGAANSPLENIGMKNVKIRYRGGMKKGEMDKLTPYPKDNPRSLWPLQAWGFSVRNVQDLLLRDVELTYEREDQRPALIASEVQHLELEHFTASKTSSAEIMRLKKIDNLTVRNSAGLEERNGESISSLKE